MEKSLLELQGYSKRDLIKLINYSGLDLGKGFGNDIYRLSKKQLINLIRNKTEQFSKVIQLREIFEKEQYGTPERMMTIIADTFSDSISPPQPGSYFTYRYIAKTPDILYDQHPLIACFSVQSWGFSGINFHLSDFRNYTWEELNSPLYKIKTEEFNYLKTLPYRKLLYS